MELNPKLLSIKNTVLIVTKIMKNGKY
jgi:hypothetical protein